MPIPFPLPSSAAAKLPRCRRDRGADRRLGGVRGGSSLIGWAAKAVERQITDPFPTLILIPLEEDRWSVQGGADISDGGGIGDRRRGGHRDSGTASRGVGKKAIARDEGADLALHTGPTDASPLPRPLAGDQFAMPTQNSVRRHECADVAQGPTADQSSEHREPSPLIIGQPHTAAAQLRLQDAILFAKEVDDVSLLAFEPAGERRQDQLQREHDENRPDSDAV